MFLDLSNLEVLHYDAAAAAAADDDDDDDYDRPTHYNSIDIRII